jgi:hypothetical protein
VKLDDLRKQFQEEVTPPCAVCQGRGTVQLLTRSRNRTAFGACKVCGGTGRAKEVRAIPDVTDAPVDPWKTPRFALDALISDSAFRSEILGTFPPSEKWPITPFLESKPPLPRPPDHAEARLYRRRGHPEVHQLVERDIRMLGWKTGCGAFVSEGDIMTHVGDLFPGYVKSITCEECAPWLADLRKKYDRWRSEPSPTFDPRLLRGVSAAISIDPATEPDKMLILVDCQTPACRTRSAIPGTSLCDACSAGLKAKEMGKEVRFVTVNGDEVSHHHPPAPRGLCEHGELLEHYCLKCSEP